MPQRKERQWRNEWENGTIILEVKLAKEKMVEGENEIQVTGHIIDRRANQLWSWKLYCAQSLSIGEIQSATTYYSLSMVHESSFTG